MPHQLESYELEQLQKNPALPIVEVLKDGRYFTVDWDYQSAPESRVLFDRSEYLGGFINGVLVGLGVAEKNIRCASSTTGTVKKLDEGQANRLAEILTGLLHPIVKQSHKRLLNQALVMKHIQGAKENHDV
ncbi:hypothetical protein [Pseudomonas aeruginosa]|uniref:hypothetical protein n=1 Tax=Pseudomonas aeruginosa TaxID=287 RepID=UPI0022BA5081|nr:hypothetical protein [Pseudomonas aeruginosa]HCF5956597.1 hypothetical protein [Pseudomonas aeruginosa]HCF5983660.1 hypothetical protein [Pseudomonas aeruginosa]